MSIETLLERFQIAFLAVSEFENGVRPLNVCLGMFVLRGFGGKDQTKKVQVIKLSLLVQLLCQNMTEGTKPLVLWENHPKI